MDQSKKTMRHFYCRDVLWETFEQMANDFDCSIDYLINEAMRYYARSKNYQSAMATSGPLGAPPPPPMGGPARRTTQSQPPRATSPGVYRDNMATIGIQGQGQVPGGMPAGHVVPTGPAVVGGTLYLVYNNQRYPIT